MLRTLAFYLALFLACYSTILFASFIELAMLPSPSKIVVEDEKPSTSPDSVTARALSHSRFVADVTKGLEALWCVAAFSSLLPAQRLTGLSDTQRATFTFSQQLTELLRLRTGARGWSFSCRLFFLFLSSSS